MEITAFTTVARGLVARLAGAVIFAAGHQVGYFTATFAVMVDKAIKVIVSKKFTDDFFDVHFNLLTSPARRA